MLYSFCASLFFSAPVMVTTAFVVDSGMLARPRMASAVAGSFLEDFFGGNKSKSGDIEPLTEKSIDRLAGDNEENDEDLEWNVGDLKAEIDRRNEQIPPGASSNFANNDDDEFDGYAFRDIILEKWGGCFDVEFQPVRTFGFHELYLNIMPFRLGARRFRHSSEYDYLCHLQAVVEILIKYEQLDSVLAQIAETTKKPRPGTSPLVAVPLRLDLSPEQLDEIMGN